MDCFISESEKVIVQCMAVMRALRVRPFIHRLDETPILAHRIEHWSDNSKVGSNQWNRDQTIGRLQSNAPVVLGASVAAPKSVTAENEYIAAPHLFLHGRIQFLSIYTGARTPPTVLTAATSSDSVCEACLFKLTARHHAVGGGGCGGDPASAAAAVIYRTVATATELLWAVSTAPTDDTGVVVSITADIVLEEEIVVRSQTNITLRGKPRGEGSALIVIARGVTRSGRHIRVNEGGLLHELSRRAPCSQQRPRAPVVQQQL